jgi:hypothetical protein
MRLIVCSIQVHERPISARPPPKRSYRFRPCVDVGVAPISVAQPEQFILESGHTHRRLPQGVMGGKLSCRHGHGLDLPDSISAVPAVRGLNSAMALYQNCGRALLHLQTQLCSGRMAPGITLKASSTRERSFCRRRSRALRDGTLGLRALSVTGGPVYTASRPRRRAGVDPPGCAPWRIPLAQLTSAPRA